MEGAIDRLRLGLLCWQHTAGNCDVHRNCYADLHIAKQSMGLDVSSSSGRCWGQLCQCKAAFIRPYIICERCSIVALAPGAYMDLFTADHKQQHAPDCRSTYRGRGSVAAVHTMQVHSRGAHLHASRQTSNPLLVAGSPILLAAGPQALLGCKAVHLVLLPGGPPLLQVESTDRRRGILQPQQALHCR